MQKLQQQVESMRGHLYTNAKNAVPYLPTLPSHQNVSRANATQGSGDDQMQHKSTWTEALINC